MDKKSALICDEQSLYYRNPLGKKAGINKLIAAFVPIALTAVLLVFGVVMMRDNLPLSIVLLCVAVIYVGLGVRNILIAVKIYRRPYTIVIDKDNLILAQKDCYVYCPLSDIGKLSIECEGIKAALTGGGSEEISIKDNVLFYFDNGVKKSASSRNMRKIAFILNGAVLNRESGVNWGARYEETDRKI